MPHWMLKAAVQGVLSLLPKSHWWNYLVQKNVAIFMPNCAEQLRLTSHAFEYKLRQCNCHIGSYLAANHGHRFSGNCSQTIPLPECSVLELGTGLYPVIPVGLYLCDASKIWTIDKVSLLRRTKEFLHYSLDELLLVCCWIVSTYKHR
jgi:hypothetical protein